MHEEGCCVITPLIYSSTGLNDLKRWAQSAGTVKNKNGSAQKRSLQGRLLNDTITLLWEYFMIQGHTDAWEAFTFIFIILWMFNLFSVFKLKESQCRQGPNIRSVLENLQKQVKSCFCMNTTLLRNKQSRRDWYVLLIILIVVLCKATTISWLISERFGTFCLFCIAVNWIFKGFRSVGQTKADVWWGHLGLWEIQLFQYYLTFYNLHTNR